MAEVITSEWIDNRVDCEPEDKKRPMPHLIRSMLHDLCLKITLYEQCKNGWMIGLIKRRVYLPNWYSKIARKME